MLVGCGMEHVVWAELTEDCLHAVLLADACHHGVGDDVGIVLFHHQTDVVLWRLCLVYEHHLCGMIDSYLSHHLAAYRASRTGDEHLAAAEQLAHTVHVDLDFFAWQQVLYLHLSHRHLHLCLAILVPLLCALGDVYLKSCLDEEVLQFAVLQEEVVLERTHHHCLYLALAYDGSQVLSGRIDVPSHESFLVVGLAVADVSVDDKLDGLGVQRLVGDGYGSGVGSVDEGAACVVAHESILKHHLDDDARDAQHGEYAAKDGYQLTSGEGIEDILPTVVDDCIIERKIDKERQKRGVDYAQQVYKLRKAQYARIGTKDTEAHDIGGADSQQ